MGIMQALVATALLIKPCAETTGPVSRPSSCSCSALETRVQNVIPDSPPSAHDPSIAKDRDTYYLYTTGTGIPFSYSKDLKHWTAGGAVFSQAPTWIASVVPAAHNSIWAPDIVKYHGRWLLFYAVSTFGRNQSAIGVAGNTTLDPHSPAYRWVDEGEVISTHPGDNWNAIDPNFCVDKQGAPWLAAGSFWSGLKLMSLDRETYKPVAGAALIPIAQRPVTPEVRGAIEAPYIHRHSEYYYLFASFDFCCRGTGSTYNVRVGRSRDITGPYLDRDGISMLQGGGTQLLFADDRWKGPGHNCILPEGKGKTERIVYHAYDALDRGRPKLRIQTLNWDRAGWPNVVNAATDSHPQ